MTQQERDEIRALVMSFSTRISDLPEVQSLSDTDYITVVQDDGSKKHSKKATFQALLQLLKIHYPDNNGAKYQGVAHPTDQNVTLPIGTDGFWFAIDAGIYTNYGGITVGNCPKVIRYDVVSQEWSSDDLWGDINGTIGFRLKPGVTPDSLDTFHIPVRPNGSYLIDVDSLPAGALGSTVVSEFDYDGNLLKRTELESLPLDFIPQTGTDYIQVTLGYNSSNPIDIEHSEVTMSSSVKVLIEGLYNFIVDVLQGEYEAKFDSIESDITSILSRLSTAENAIQQLRTDVESLRDDIDGLSSRIDGIDGQISELGTGLDSLNTRLQETIDNIQLTVDGIWARFEDDEGYISDLQLTARLFQVRLSDAEGNISTLSQTAEEISAQVENAQGDIALLYIRADEIGTRVTNAEGDISTLTQRADDITAQVQNAQGDIATLQITAAQISSTVQNMQGDMSVLEQTAQQISARVTNVEGDVSELYITANEIGSRVTDAEGNISTLTQTSTALTARLEDAEGDITALEVTANGLSTRITNTEGDISTLQLTASSLESRIENAEGNISTLTQTAEGISARVSNTENDISELSITAGEISARVSDAEDNISALTVRADGIEARVSDNEDNIASLELTAEGLTTRVSDAEGDISTLQQTATSLTSRITDAEGDISTLEQTATSLSSRISTAEGNITTINQDIDSIELSVSTISTNLINYEALTDAALSNLQDQIDGVVQTWYAEGVPTLSNYPANEWDADEKPNHVGDLYYDKLTGKAYRFMLDGSQEPPVYVWTLIADEDVAKALALAGEKKRVFVTTPYPPYDVGDLWVKERTVNNVTTREIYKCVTSRAAGDTINLDTDWVTADNYGYQVNKANLEVLTNKIVGKVTQITYNQDGTISSQSASLIEQNANEIKLQVANGAIDDALDSGGSINSALLPTGIDITNEKVVITANHFYLKGNNVGSDAALVLVYKDNVPKISVVNLDVTGVFQTNEWSTQVTNLNTTAQGYADTAESNANSYADGVGASTLDDAKDYSDGNLQLAKDYADNIETSAINTAEDYFNTIVYGNGGTAEHPTSGSILYTINNLGDEYTTLNNQINVGNNSLVSQINTLSGHLTDMGYLAEALLNGRTVIGGGLILSSLIQLGSNPGGQNWQVWSGINGVYDSSAYGNGIAAWYGGAMLDRYYSGNTDTNRAARSLFRFDGSGYLANQKIRWDYDNNDVKLVIDGYVLTHEVQLGYTDQSDVWHTMAGISGSYDATDAANGYGIAAWYGGEKIDRKKTPSATNGATSLFRFDGSGYLANRQIEWGASGELIIHGQSTENPITIENAVLTQGNLSVTIGDLLELKSWFVKEAFTIPGDSTTHYRLKLVGSTTGLEGLHVEGHILSDADQIVGSGSASGGGGGSASYLSDLLDLSETITDKPTGGGYGLVYSTSATDKNGDSGAWIYVAPGTAANISGANTTARLWSGNVIKSAIEAYGYVTTDNKVTQTATTTSSAYELLFSATADNTTRTEGARKTSTLTYNPSTKALLTGGTVDGLTLAPQTTGFKISGGTTSKTLTVGANYTLGAACAKGVTDNSSATAVTSSDTNLITARTLYYAGYVKSSGVTSITLTSGTGITVSDSGTAITGTGSRTISLNVSGAKTALGLGTMAYETASNYLTTTTAASTYVKLSPGTSEQTISSSISSFVKGVINLWRSSGDHYTFLGFSNGTTETYLGGIGFKSQSDHNLYHKDGSNYYTIFDENNYTSYVNTTNFPGLNKTGTVTKVSTGTGLTGGDITTTGTISINSTYQGYITHGESAYNSLGNYLPLAGGTMTGNLKWNNSTALPSTTSTSYILCIDAFADGGTTKYIATSNLLGDYVLKAGDTMTGDLIIEKTGGGLTIRGERLNANANGGYIYLAGRYYNNDRNGVKIAAEYPGSGGYDVQDLVFYTSNNLSGNASPVWQEAMRIKADKAVSMNGWLSVSRDAVYNIYANNTASDGTASGIRFQLGGTTKGGLFVSSDENLYYSVGTASTGNKVLTSANYDGYALPLAGGTMTGSIKLTNGTYINAESGYAMCGIGSGGETFYCGPGAEITSAFYLRSGNINLTHVKAGTNYAIWDASNSNLSTVDWAAKNLSVSGTSTFSDTMYVENRKYMQWKDSGGTYRNIFGLNNTNELLIGYGLSSVTGSATALYGETIRMNATSVTELVKTGGGATLMLRGSALNNAPGTILFRGGTSDSNGFKIEAEPYGSYGRVSLSFYSSNVSSGDAPYTPDWKRSMRIYYNGNIHLGVDGAFYPTVYSYGPIVIGTTTNNANLTVRGTISSTGDHVISSDATLKTNWREVEYGVNDIAKTTIGIFDWKDGHGTSIGTKAQDWEKLTPQLVHGEDGNKSLAYGQVALVNTVLLARHDNEQDKEIEELKNRIVALENEINQLKNGIQ